MSAPTEDPTSTTSGRVEVVAGGAPSPEQLAAVVVALTPATAVASDATRAEAPAWARAALLESVVERRIATPAGLRAPGGV